MLESLRHVFGDKPCHGVGVTARRERDDNAHLPRWEALSASDQRCRQRAKYHHQHGANFPHSSSLRFIYCFVIAWLREAQRARPITSSTNESRLLTVST